MLREAIESMLHSSPCCPARIIFTRSILVVLSTPQRVLFAMRKNFTAQCHQRGLSRYQ